MVSEHALTSFLALAIAPADHRLADDNVASTDTLSRLGLQRHTIPALYFADLLTLHLDNVDALHTLRNARIALKPPMFSLLSFLTLDHISVIELHIPLRPTGEKIPVYYALMRAKNTIPTFLEPPSNVLESHQNVDNT